MAKLTLKGPLSFGTQARLAKLANPGLVKPPLLRELDPDTACVSKPDQPEAPKFPSEHEKGFFGAPGHNGEEVSGARKVNQRKSREKFEEAKLWFQKTFPKAFDFQEPKPLKVGIHHDILGLEAPISRTQRARAIRAYVCSPAYLKAVANGQWRCDLNGEPVEEILPEQKTRAEEKLFLMKAPLGKKHA